MRTFIFGKFFIPDLFLILMFEGGVMAKIIYGLAGEGMGHATRSKVVIQHLLSKGHDVHVVASHRAYDFLAKSFPKITRIPGLQMKYKDNRVLKMSTVWENIRHKKGEDAKKAIELVKGIIKEDRPDLIITDYEPIVAHLAGMMSWDAVMGKNKIPLVSIDNMHVISNCKLDVPKKFRDDYLVVKYGNDLMVPPQNVCEYLVTTFFYPKVKRRKTILIPSLIRDAVINKKPSDGSHILVYQTSKSYTSMFDIMKSFKREKFVVYGFNVSKRDKNLVFRKFSENGFINDLASCKAAITNGGFTMMSEAVFLGKPVLSVPVKRHFEQICNALYLDRAGYGEFHEELTSSALAGFLYKLQDYKHNLKKYRQKDNSKSLGVVDKVVSKIMNK